ncbi:hypothetical protein L0F63_003996 [Massospora cicadina]|nr:hypothetical protein L0F63_003996 [Massospora cicadina]
MQHSDDNIPDIPGRPLDKEFAQILKREVGTLLSCAQPVSFSLEHIQELKEENYFVCEKSDGVRCLMLSRFNPAVKRPEIFLVSLQIDRKNEYRFLPNIYLPSPNPHAPNGFHHLTLIDGELVNDREPDGKTILRYLAFDLLSIDGRSMINKPFTSRQGHLRVNVVDQFVAWNRRKGFVPPLEIQAKVMELSYGMIHILKDQVPRLKHRSDGLIFTSVQAFYVPGTCNTMLKWKPPNENSVDFKLKIEGQGPTQLPRFCLAIWKGGDQYEIVDEMGVTPSEWRQFKSMFGPKVEARLQDRIVEVTYDVNHCPPHTWRFMRFRDDKPHANHISVLEKIRKSIVDNIDMKMLEQECPDVRLRWKEREARSKLQAVDARPVVTHPTQAASAPAP